MTLFQKMNLKKNKLKKKNVFRFYLKKNFFLRFNIFDRTKKYLINNPRILSENSNSEQNAFKTIS